MSGTAAPNKIAEPPPSPPLAARSPQVERLQVATPGPSPVPGREEVRAVHIGGEAMPAVTPVDSKPRKRAALVVGGVLVVLIGLSAAGYFGYQSYEAKRWAELERLQQVEEANRRAVEAEQARVRAEEQARKLADEKTSADAHAQKLVLEKAQAELSAAKDRAAREAASRAQMQATAEREAAARRQAEEQAQRARAAAAQGSAAQRAPAPSQVQRPGSAQAACSQQKNLILRGICEGIACQKPEYFDTEYCRVMRAKSATQPQDRPGS